MRRVAGVLLIVLGVFAITMGALLRFVVHERLGVAPLDPGTTTVAEGTNMTVFYPKSLVDKTIPAQRTDATLRAQRIVNGKLDAPEVKINGDVAMWRVGLVVEDENKILINAVEQWVCVDRRTGEGVRPCRDQKVDDGTRVDTNYDQKGLNYKFPFGTERKDYTFFDITLRRATPIAFDGDDTIEGLSVYRFVQRIEPIKIEDREVPASLVGGTTGTVTAERYYQNVRTLWVEPYTGIIVKGQEQVRQVLRAPDGRDAVVLLAGTLTFNNKTIQEQVQKAEEGRSQLRMLKQTGPVLAWIAGGVLVAVGMIMVLLSPPSGDGPTHARGAPRAPRGPRRRASLPLIGSVGR